jgi:hypothetical protein
MRLTHLACCFLLTLAACGDDANDRGVGATCAMDTDCTEEGQRCLTQFSGGYCGISGCTRDLDCPDGSACVTEDDGTNYCFLVCVDKPDCNENRPVENEASCVSSLPFVEGAMGRKVCRPSLGA